MAAIAIDQLVEGNRRALAKAITLIESKLESHRKESQLLLEQLLPKTGTSIRIGITGVPGVGKSTFIEALGLYLVAQGHKVAVLAVDPSSPLEGGSILGDKTRMELLSQEANAFIRPSPAGDSLGGVAQKTRETMLLCEAAGYDVILVETVGVGQSEYEVAGMVDFFMVLMLPNSGDELQGIKKGILELADALVINKADGESIGLAQQTCRNYASAMKLIRRHSFWKPRVLSCSAQLKEGIDSIWEMVSEYRKESLKNNAFYQKRTMQNKEWMQHLITELLERKLNESEAVKKLRPELEQKVINGETTAYLAANRLISLL
jgi:LAO/AO transport system kinase